MKYTYLNARLKYWAWLIVAVFMLVVANFSHAQTLPGGYVGRVQNNVANQWATYSFTFTPTVSGSQYIMFAFRQDPAYWYFDNAKLTVQGQTTNLLTNSNFQTGGNLTVNTANYGTLSINAPTAWGVGYQSGIYPSAAGTWSGGQWIDGAVGSFDSIYQAVSLNAGTTYTITFDAMSNNTVDNNSVQLGVYAGQCTNLTMAPSNCSLPSGSGFETVAAPAATYTVGCTTDCPPPPGPAPNIRPTWPNINRPAAQIGFGTGRTGVWRSSWCDNQYGCGNTFDVNYINWNQYTGDGFHNYNYTYMRWPGTDNGVSRTIWFRIGYDDNHHLKINGQTVAAGPCCQYTYGSYTAKPGEIVKLEFWSDNSGGGPYIGQVAWDPDGDGVYTLLGAGDVGLQSPTEGGGSYWYSSDITTDQTNIVTSARSRVNAVSGNQIWIEEKLGSTGNTVTIEQTGYNNRVQGLGGGDAIIDGQSNNLNIKQGDGVGKNLIELGVYGASNTVTIWQARNVDTGVQNGQAGGHYAGLGINGDNNTVSIKQGNQGSILPGHFSLVYVKGDSNNINVKQSNSYEKKAFISVDGDTNTINLQQKDVGSHYVDLMLTGNSHSANITQSGSGTHKATINLQNAGGASSLTLLQQGSTGQQYSIMQQCANLSGCSVSVTQGTGP